MNKVIRNGQVAVLYSPGFGAGWFTWNDDNKKWLLFHPDLIAAVEAGKRKMAGDLAERLGHELYGKDDYTCVLGARNLEIAWIPKGESFEITEYDGNESFNIISKQTYLIA